MIGVKVIATGLFLDLEPGTTAEVEYKSPFFSMSDYPSEGTNDSITFKYTKPNSLALAQSYHYFTARKKTRIPVEHWDGTTLIGRATLIVDAGRLNLNNIEASTLNGTLVYGISEFFQEIKDKKLRELEMGGDRVFPWTTNDPLDNSHGWWQHINETLLRNDLPYMFYAIRNESYLGEGGPVSWLNGLNNDGYIDFNILNNPIIPMLKLDWLTEYIFNEHGWSVDFSGLNDNNWRNIYQDSLIEADWYEKIVYTDISTGEQTPFAYPKASVILRLNEHLPDRLISDFLVQFFLGFGFAPIFNRYNKVCRMVAAKEVGLETIDWTPYCHPEIPTDFNSDDKIYGLSNDVDPGDSNASAPDFTGKKFGDAVINPTILPNVANAPDDGLLRYSFSDNKWYQIVLDETASPQVYEWIPFADNIYSDGITDATDTITSTISTLPVVLTHYRTASTIPYYGYFPYMKQEKGSDFGYRFLLMAGQQYDVDAAGNQGARLYAMATSLCLDNMGNQVLDWSLPYTHTKRAGTAFAEDFGRRAYWWSRFLKMIADGEEEEVTVYLPKPLLGSFSWEQEILIKHVPHLVMSYVQPVPYEDRIVAKLLRILPVVVNNGIITLPPIYVHVSVENIQLDPTSAGTFTNYYSCDVISRMYSDPTGLIPYTPPVAIELLVEIAIVVNSVPYPANVTFQVIAQQHYLKTRVMHSGEAVLLGVTQYYSSTYTLLLDPHSIYTVI